MLKKLVFCLILVLLPYGVKAQRIHCDTTFLNYQKVYHTYGWIDSFSTETFVDTIIHCSTFFSVDTSFWQRITELPDSLRIDSIKIKIFPHSNWQDSIEQCKNKIDSLKRRQDPYFYSKDIEQDIEFWKLKLQIYELRALLQKKGVIE